MGKTKNQTGQKPGNHSPKQVQELAAKKLREVAQKMVGPEGYNLFSSYMKELILHNRYGAVKLKADPSCNLESSHFKILDELFKTMLRETDVQLENKQQLSLADYHREGLMLIHYVEMAAKELPGDHTKLITAFAPYFRETKFAYLFLPH